NGDDLFPGLVVALSGASGNVLFDRLGETGTGNFGSALAGAGDLNADGRPDVLIGARGFSNVVVNRGKIYAYDIRGGCEDRDGDGFGGPCDMDCDETNAAINPDATDIPENGIDEDCDGGDLPLLEPRLLFTVDGTGAGDGMGDLYPMRVARLGDINGDGIDDLAIGVPSHEGPAGPFSGQVLLRSGANGAAIATLNGVAGLGVAVAGGGDVNGDGVGDFIVIGSGLPQPDALVRVYSGATRALLGAIVPDGLNFGFKIGLKGAPDFNGDAVPDWLVGSLGDTSVSGIGSIAWVSGATTTAYRIILGPGEASDFGSAIDVVPDVDGDAVPDVVGGAWAKDYVYGGVDPDSGWVSVHSGADGTRLMYVEGTSREGLGFDVAGIDDMDGDGAGDVLASTLFYPAEGRVLLYSGRSGGLIRTWDGTTVGDGFGYDIETIADVDGNGRPDVLVGAPELYPTGTGRVVILSPVNGQKRAEISGESPGDYFGFDLAALGDLTGDGYPEFAVVAPGYDGPAGEDSGRVYVYSLRPAGPGPCTDADGDGYAVRAGAAAAHFPWYDALCGYVDCD
ncbi:MAG: FG-GAP repeat protein, partial [Myxococcales bacterium]|nr:FG-GAP repeat protein [Myxococcales bacterium]